MIYRSLEEELYYPLKLKRGQDSGKAYRRLRLYWRIVEKENRDRPYRTRPKHFRKRVSVVISNVVLLTDSYAKNNSPHWTIFLT